MAGWPTSPEYCKPSTPRAAALAGVLFALLFGAVIVLIRSSLPEAAQPGARWIDDGHDKIRLASELDARPDLLPVAIGVVRANLGRYEDKFFATDTGSGLLFLAMMPRRVRGGRRSDRKAGTTPATWPAGSGCSVRCCY